LEIKEVVVIVTNHLSNIEDLIRSAAVNKSWLATSKEACPEALRLGYSSVKLPPAGMQSMLHWLPTKERQGNLSKLWNVSLWLDTASHKNAMTSRPI